MFKEVVLLVLTLHVLIEALPLEETLPSRSAAVPKADFDMMETAETKYKGGGGGGGGGKVYIVKGGGGGHRGGHHGGGGACCRGGGGGKGFKKG